MVSYTVEQFKAQMNVSVLIHVVVEDGLVQLILQLVLLASRVLILVVVEDGLVHASAVAIVLTNIVLILVVVEDGLVRTSS